MDQDGWGGSPLETMLRNAGDAVADFAARVVVAHLEDKLAHARAAVDGYRMGERMGREGAGVVETFLAGAQQAARLGRESARRWADVLRPGSTARRLADARLGANALQALADNAAARAARAEAELEEARAALAERDGPGERVPRVLLNAAEHARERAEARLRELEGELKETRASAAEVLDAIQEERDRTAARSAAVLEVAESLGAAIRELESGVALVASDAQRPAGVASLGRAHAAVGNAAEGLRQVAALHPDAP